MNTEKFHELTDVASDNLASKFAALKEHAEHFIAQQVEAMKERGDAFELSEDETRLLHSYRRFKTRSAPGTVFSWKSPCDQEIVLPSDPCLIVDPREVSS